MVSGLLNFGTNGPKKEIFIYPHSAGWKKGGNEIGPLPHQRFLCLLGSALLLGSAFGDFLFVFCGVGFSLLLLWGFVVCWGCLGVAFGWLGSAGPPGAKYDPDEETLSSAKGSEPLGSGSTCPGNGRGPPLGLHGGTGQLIAGGTFRAKGRVPCPFSGLRHNKVGLFSICAVGAGPSALSLAHHSSNDALLLTEVGRVCSLQ